MEPEINYYLNTLAKKLQTRTVVSRSVSYIACWPLAVGQCSYISDYRKQEIIYQNGVAELLGYNMEQFTMEKFFALLHPSDKTLLLRLTKVVLNAVSESNVYNGMGYHVTYRIKHADGHYLHVLQQGSAFDVDSAGRMISMLYMLTDISFMEQSEKVQWKFTIQGMDQKKFRKQIVKENTSLFSNRELEIIRYLKNGNTSADIAARLFISKHTVDGHRRKMLEKSNCKNTIDLINFCESNRII
ncbi:MAG: LuxR C-terminal-related transcriptional regulator [Bacteroidia bacterium]|jgi:DNA-binding NarL/FixJ family response regulator